MLNILQKIIYLFSACAPLGITFSIVWYFQKGTLFVPIISSGVSIIFIMIFFASFSYGKKHLSSITIRTTDVAPNDGWVIVYIFTYILPFASVVIKDFDPILCLVVSILLILAAPCVNSAIPNPLLFATGYHFYQIGSKNGISGYVLISKRKLRKSKDLTVVNRVFEFLLLDAEGR